MTLCHKVSVAVHDAHQTTLGGLALYALYGSREHPGVEAPQRFVLAATQMYDWCHNDSCVDGMNL